MKTSSLGAFVLALALCVAFSSPSPAAKPPSVQSSRIQTGQTAPDFTLADQTGANVTLSAARGKSPVVLVFYRGWW